VRQVAMSNPFFNDRPILSNPFMNQRWDGPKQIKLTRFVTPNLNYKIICSQKSELDDSFLGTNPTRRNWSESL